jgi:surface carbohydrate biosynthesis protein
MLYVISVESQQRELDAQVLLGARLAKEGHSVLLAQDQLLRKIIVQLGVLTSGQIILIDKSASVSCIPKRIGPLKRAFPNSKVVVLFQEGWVGDRDLSPSHRLYTSTDAVEYVDEFYVFGPTQLDMFAEATPSCRSIAHATGNPRIDFLTTYRDFFKPQIALIKATYGDFNLITCPFVVRTLSSNAHDQRYPPSWESDPKWGDALRLEFEIRERTAAKTYSIFLDLIAKLASANSDKAFVFRPHPTSRVADAVSRLEEHRNVFFARHYPVEPWILAARGVITHGCTTGLQAKIAGVEHLAFSIPDSPYIGSPSLRGADGYILTVGKDILVSANNPEDRLKLESIYSNIGSAVEIVASRLLNLAPDQWGGGGNSVNKNRSALLELISTSAEQLQYWKWEYNFQAGLDYKMKYLSSVYRAPINAQYLGSGAILVSPIT